METTRYNSQGRRLCNANDNTCPNLSGYRETRNGVRRYRTQCDAHRRPGHTSRGFVTPRSKRYIPLTFCQLCGTEDRSMLERHRVKKGLEYRPKNVLVLCQPCHRTAHRLTDLLAEKGYFVKRRYELK